MEGALTCGYSNMRSAAGLTWELPMLLLQQQQLAACGAGQLACEAQAGHCAAVFPENGCTAGRRARA